MTSQLVKNLGRNKRYDLRETCLKNNLLASNSGCSNIVLKVPSESPVKTLRPYQNDMFEAVLGNSVQRVVSPMGSGKNMVMLAIAARLMAKKVPVFIATSKIAIISSGLEKYTSHSGVHFRLNDGELLYLPQSCVESPRQDKVSVLRKALRQGEGISVISHRALDMALSEMDPSEYGDAVFLIDEGHHGGYDEDDDVGTNLGKAIDRLSKTNQVCSFTATDGRNDGLDMGGGREVYRRTMVDHYREGYCPDINVKVVIYDDVGEDEYRSLDNSNAMDARNVGNATKLIRAYVRTFKKQLSDGPVKQTMMVIPPNSPGRNSRMLALRLEKMLRKCRPDLRILNLASNDGISLVSEQTTHAKLKQYGRLSTEKLDVVIVISVMDEGVDWVDCCQVFEPRVPGSIVTIAQRSTGRAMRLKPECHPYRNSSDIYFFELGIKEEDKHTFHKPLLKLAIRMSALFNGLAFKEPCRFNIANRDRPDSGNGGGPNGGTYPRFHKIMEDLLEEIASDELTLEDAVGELAQELDIDIDTSWGLMLPYFADAGGGSSLKDRLVGMSFNTSKDFRDFLKTPEIKKLMEQTVLKDVFEWYGFISSNKVTSRVAEIIRKQAPDSGPYSYAKARRITIDSGARSHDDYYRLRSTYPRLPKRPEKFYAERGWVNWPIFLGRKDREDYCPRSLKSRVQVERKYCKCPSCEKNLTKTQD